AKERELRVHRISQGSGMMLLTDDDVREMVALGQEHGIEVCLFTGPRAAWDVGVQATAPAGRVVAGRPRGAAQLPHGPPAGLARGPPGPSPPGPPPRPAGSWPAACAAPTSSPTGSRTSCGAASSGSAASWS